MTLLPLADLRRRVLAPGRDRRWPSGRVALSVFLVALAVATALRCWHLATSPAWQWDEAVYYQVSVHVQHGVLDEHALLGLPWQPFLYQPPFYFLMLSRWFDLVGASILHARVLGVILTAAMFPVLGRLIWKLHGPRAALFASVPVVFDGWLMYIERISYIENALIFLISTAFLLYQRALEKPSWLRFAVVGFVAGFAADFKQTGVYVLLAILLCWLIVRRAHLGHLVLVGTAIAVVIVYIIAMDRMFDLPGHDWYFHQSLVQVRRVLGLQRSGGTLTSPDGAIHLLISQYQYFVPSVLVAIAAFLTALRRLLQCYRMRNWLPVQDNALLFSWLVAGLLVFGFSALKFPQYFALILIPGYCFIWTEVARWEWRWRWKCAAAGVATLASVVTFIFALPAFSANTLQETQQFAAARIPRRAVVVTEQSVGDLIRQPWCTVEYAVPCLRAASYAITWRTYLQSSFHQGDPAFFQLMKGAARVRTFTGAVGTATVWKLRSNP
jgi:4-amino-4-deoxy-L-arabinose transferase-like glycosyltransferase